MERIGVRELRQYASRYLGRVAAGESFVVTDHGRPRAQLVPVADDPWDDLVAQGALGPATGAPFWKLEPPAGGPSLSQAAAYLRDDER